MLCEIISKQWNHRVALHKMRCVEKIQTTIVYIYQNRASYNKIFWINAVIEEFFLRGFQEISINALNIKSVDLKDYAKLILTWFENQHNWLIVINNFDDIEIVKDCLSYRELIKHTLITTRNSNAKEISAWELEMILSNFNESIEMLCTLFDMNIEDHRHDSKAQQVVEELRFLSLALNQAESYVQTI